MPNRDKRITDAGIHAMLIGKLLIKAEDTGEKIKDLLGMAEDKER